MSNRGTQLGSAPGTWRLFDTEMRVASVSGTSTPLTQGGSAVGPFGRWTYIADKKAIMFQIQFNFGVAPAKGVGNAYLLKLPKPAKRSFIDADIQPVIGVGFNYHAISGNAYNQPVILQLSRQYSDNGNEEDNWLEMVTGGYALTFGTGSISGRTATSTTITHSLGYTPLASDIDITWTGVDQTLQTTQGHWWISNITSTTFDVNIRSAVDW